MALEMRLVYIVVVDIVEFVEGDGSAIGINVGEEEKMFLGAEVGTVVDDGVGNVVGDGVGMVFGDGIGMVRWLVKDG